jgi:hypothetical protein
MQDAVEWLASYADPGKIAFMGASARGGLRARNAFANCAMKESLWLVLAREFALGHFWR